MKTINVRNEDIAYQLNFGYELNKKSWFTLLIFLLALINMFIQEKNVEGWIFWVVFFSVQYPLILTISLSLTAQSILNEAVKKHGEL